MIDHNKFENYRIHKNQDINDAAKELIKSVASPTINPDAFVWNDDLIAETIEAVMDLFEKYNVHSCRPYNAKLDEDTKIPCYLEACCSGFGCPFACDF